MIKIELNHQIWKCYVKWVFLERFTQTRTGKIQPIHISKFLAPEETNPKLSRKEVPILTQFQKLLLATKITLDYNCSNQYLLVNQILHVAQHLYSQTDHYKLRYSRFTVSVTKTHTEINLQKAFYSCCTVQCRI